MPIGFRGLAPNAVHETGLLNKGNNINTFGRASSAPGLDKGTHKSSRPSSRAMLMGHDQHCDLESQMESQLGAQFNQPWGAAYGNLQATKPKPNFASLAGVSLLLLTFKLTLGDLKTQGECPEKNPTNQSTWLLNWGPHAGALFRPKLACLQCEVSTSRMPTPKFNEVLCFQVLLVLVVGNKAGWRLFCW